MKTFLTKIIKEKEKLSMGSGKTQTTRKDLENFRYCEEIERERIFLEDAREDIVSKICCEIERDFEIEREIEND